MKDIGLVGELKFILRHGTPEQKRAVTFAIQEIYHIVYVQGSSQRKRPPISMTAASAVSECAMRSGAKRRRRTQKREH